MNVWFSNLYADIGGKIKTLAAVVFALEAVAAVIGGIMLMATDHDLIVTGIFTMLLGPIVAWISSWLLYGFGEIIDKLCIIERNTRGEIAQPGAPQQGGDDRRSNLERLRAEGLISEEEYRQLMQ